MVKLSKQSLPKHIAIIMDGNGRWAESRGLPRSDGHRAGVAAVKRTVIEIQRLGIKYLTLFGFSSENWKRPSLEIDDLMWLLRRFLKNETTHLLDSNVRIRVIGDRSNFSRDIVDLINKTEELTNTNDGLKLTAALSYGGRQEILEAAKSLAVDIHGGNLLLDEVDQQKFSSYLFTSEIPDPDLLIRTSGEQRISNFLLWQMAYTELVFCDVLWPDFNEMNLALAIKEFNSRERRFGDIADKK